MRDTTEKLSSRQLLTVFRLCDPEESGRVQIERLQSLAEIYADGDSQEICEIFRQLDPKGRGTLSFKEFFTGVRQILRRRQNECPHRYLNNRDNMMSPIQAANDPSSMGNGLSPPSEDPSKSQCSSLSDGENYEWQGDGNQDLDVDSGIVHDRSISDNMRPRSPASAITRHTWLRTSLRRSPPSHQENLPNRRWGSFRHSSGKQRQLGSNALASQLYRSSSFNSSGRSSTCDTADDMYSDASLEEDVHDLHHKFQVLQHQVGVLQDSAHQNDERYTRAKADNAALQARVIMLEEQLRDAEMRHEERLQDEQRRCKELVARVEREKQLQLENSSIRLQAAELEATNLKEEVTRQRIRIEKLETERKQLTDQIMDLRNEIITNKESESDFKDQERRLNQERDAQSLLIEELSREVERLRSEARTPALPTTSPETLRLEELHEEMAALRAKNQQLQEANEELQATLLHTSVEQGRLLTAGENSLAAELEAMTHDELVNPQDSEAFIKIQQALKEQQEVNAHLRIYIDGILLNIVENHPQLLEVKQRSV